MNHTTGLEQHYANLNVSFDSNNVTTLTFRNEVVSNFSAWAPMIEQFTDPSRFTVSVTCTSAISGQYGFLPRLLYYLLLVFAVLLRHQTWLATAAVATAMSYASTAAIHMFALFIAFDNGKKDNSPKSGSDIDLYAAFLIVIAGAVILPPILNWCRTMRENKAWIVVACWGLLQFTAAIGFLMVFLINDPYLYTVPSFALCQQDSSKQCGAVFIKSPVLTSLQIYNKCQCIDYCGTINTNIPLRKGQNYQAWLTPDPILGITQNRGFNIGLIITSVILLLATVNGLFGLLESRWTQIQIRNWIYWKLAGTSLDRMSIRLLKRISHRYERPNQDHPLGLAKGIAATIYLYSAVMTVICIPFFIAVIVINEIVVRRIPVGESSDAVGQWATWVGAVFVLLAAIIQDFKSWFRYFVEKLFHEPLARIRTASRSWSRILPYIIEAVKDFISEFQQWWKNPAQYTLLSQPVESSGNVPIISENIQFSG